MFCGVLLFAVVLAVFFVVCVGCVGAVLCSVVVVFLGGGRDVVMCWFRWVGVGFVCVGEFVALCLVFVVAW